MSLAPVVVTIEPVLNEIEGAISISGSQWSIEFQCLLSADGGTLEAEWRGNIVVAEDGSVVGSGDGSSVLRGPCYEAEGPDIADTEAVG